MNSDRYFILVIVTAIALAAITIFMVNLIYRKPRPMMAETCKTAGFLALAGALMFLGGVWLLVYKNEHQSAGLELAGIGLLLGTASIVLNAIAAKAKRAAWPIVSARCIKQKLQKCEFQESDNYWLWHLVCEVNYAGKKYQVEPKVHWSDTGQSEAPFSSEAKAQKFLSERISPNGACKIRINPENPLEAELLK